jgi:VanZ family protein
LARNFYLFIAVCLTILIFVGSLISFKGNNTVQIHISDKIIHSVAYYLLTLSWLLAYLNKFEKLKHFVVIALFVFLYGALIEGCQMLFTTYRQGDIYDLLANLVGIMGALVFFSIIIKKIK